MITEYSEFPEFMPRSRILDECFDNVGLLGKGWGTEKISFLDNRVFPTYSEAQRFLAEVAADTYDGCAVLYEVYDNNLVNNDPIVMTIREDIRKMQLSIDNYKDHVRITFDPASPFFKCKVCGSTLATKYLKGTMGTRCPVCHHDMRSDQDIARIEALELQLSSKRKELSEAEDDAKHRLQSTGRRWLVQYKIAN